MNRNVTNVIRFIMDEMIPPFIRDSKWFMYIFYYIWFKGKNISVYMHFKDTVWDMTEEEFVGIYRNLDCVANDRPSDSNEQTIDYMLKNIDPEAKTLADIGCGRGYWLNMVSEKTNLAVTGCDLYDSVSLKSGNYVKGSIAKLPFADKSFDIVTCCHTIEHLRNLPEAISELKRITRKQLIIVTPKQKYYYYTLDLHVNFFPIKGLLQKEIGIAKYSCEDLAGDWCYLGQVNP